MSASELYHVFLEQWFRNRNATDLDLIRAYKDSPYNDQDYKNKLVSGALRRTRYQFAEYLFSQGAIADQNLFYENGLREHILRYTIGRPVFMGYIITPGADWVDTFIRFINTDLYIDTFIEVIHAAGDESWNDKRKCHTINYRNLMYSLIDKHRYATVKRLVESGLVIPSVKTISMFYANPPRNNPEELAESIFVATNSAKWPKEVQSPRWRQHFLSFHKSARQRRTLREIALIQCARASVPYNLPDPISWHLRQDLYRIEKCKRILNGI